MKISHKWLKEYIKTDLSAEQTAKILTDTGLEVEGIEEFESVKGGLEGMVIGEVLTKEKHPDADRLSVTTVSIGSGEPLNIVCGASNVAAGQKIVVATVGATLYPLKGESFQIKKSKIRGAVSEGMICAEDEIGLGESHEGIMVLDPEAKVGLPASEYFKLENDFIFEIGLTPNRADAASHIGVARDLAAALTLSKNKKITVEWPAIDAFSVKEKTSSVSVEIEDVADCPRYSGISIKNVKVDTSPDWLQNRLKAIGLKPINNIVDITNFVLHETGQPLHAFDADKIEGNKVIIKKANEGDKFTTLDDVERMLKSNNLMICNAEKPMVIAGVLGGKNSGVTEETKNIFLESAYFNPVSIRKSSKDHGLKTDASFRYERGTDPNLTIYALKRAAILMEQITGGKINSEIIDVYPDPVENFKIEFSLKNCKRLIGAEIDPKTIKIILSSLDIIIENETENRLSLSIPPYRVDVTRETDVFEEILRIYGYNNIELPRNLRTSVNISVKPDKEKITNIASDYLSAKGFNEIMSNSLTKAEYTELSSLFNPDENVIILNPLSSDLNSLRRSLLFGCLEAVSYNQNRKNTNLKLYEFGKIYSNTGDRSEYIEKNKLAILVSGNRVSESWNNPDRKIDFYLLKGLVNSLLERLGIDYKVSSEAGSDLFSYGLTFTVKKRILAEIGELNKKLIKHFDLNQEVFYAELDWELIMELQKTKQIQYKEVPKFPSVRRDLALLLDKNIKFAEISDTAFQSERNLLKEVNLFDVYEGDKIEAGKKSYAISFILQDQEKTLTDQQIDKIMEKLLRNFEEKHSAKLR